MAKLTKRLEDHFYLSIILRPIGAIHNNTLSYFVNLMNAHFSNFQLEIDEASEVITYLKDILIDRPTNINPHYKIRFYQDEPHTEWPQLEILYRSQFVIGINADPQENPQKIKDNLLKFRKQLSDQRRHELAIFLIKADKQIYYKITVDKSFIFLPNVGEMDLISFLQMEMSKLVKQAVFFVGDEIKKLMREENQCIVFNKNQEKPDQKNIKKKKRGRCFKLAGDYCLMIASIVDGLECYNEAFQLLKRLDDHIWLMAIQQGRAAVYFSRLINTTKQQQSDYQTNLEHLNFHLNQSIINIKKAKFQQFVVDSYFMAFQALSTLQQKALLQEWVTQFVSQQLKLYVPQDQAIFLAQIGLIYQNLKMFRKCNYYFCLVAQIYLPNQPEIARMFLQDIRKKYPNMKQWTKLYSLLLRQLIISDPNDNFQGKTYAELIDLCHSILPEADLFSQVQKLNMSYFQKLNHQFQFLKLVKFQIQKPKIVPKLNRLIKSTKESGGGLVVAPRKKQQSYKYEMNQNIQFVCELISQVKFSLALKISLFTQPQTSHRVHNVLLERSRSLTLLQSFKQVGNFYIQGLHINLWNYSYPIKLPKEIAIEVYPQCSCYQIIIPSELNVQKSSQFQFNFQLNNTKPHIQSCLVKVNISIYYWLQVGLQQNVFFLSPQMLKNPRVNVICKESTHKQTIAICNEQRKQILVELQSLKVDRQHIKKLQISLEYIREESAKYQINISKNIIVKFYQKIECQIVSLFNQHPIALLSQNELPLWESTYRMIIRISKKPEDKKVYEIQIKNINGQIIGKRILGDEASFQEKLEFERVDVQKQCQVEKYLRQAINLSWKSIINPLQSGIVKVKLLQNLNKSAIKKSSKMVRVQYLIDGELIPEDKPLILGRENLLIKYIGSSVTNNLSHRAYLESIQFKQNGIGFVIDGKTTIKSSQNSIQNQLQVQFSTSYYNKFVLILLFSDEMYVSERIIQVQC